MKTPPGIRERFTGTRGVIRSPAPSAIYSTVTDFARLRGWSTLQPRRTAT